MRILLVEDDPMIGSVIEQELRDASYAVDWVRDGQAALTTLATLSYSLVLLDLGLPRTDGMAVLRSLRAGKNNVPVLVLTARDGTEDLVAGLDGGADDYLVKPFQISVLLARMRALTRRNEGSLGPVLTNGIVSLDPASHEAHVNDAAVRLTGREFALLEALLRRPGAILSRAGLESHIYGWNEEIESNTVEVYVHGLRKKLGAEFIKNVRGVGYMVGANT